MTDKENITAILECYFSGFKKEIIDSACNRILELKHHINVDVLVPKKQELSQAIFDAGYKQGYNEGTASHDGEQGNIYYGGYGDGYKDGLNDAWECVKKIAYNNTIGGFDLKELKEIFDGKYLVSDILLNYSASEAVKRVKAWEEKQKQINDEIKVGDEVVDGEVFNSGKGIVTFVSPLTLYVLWYDGSTGRRKLTDVKKTGKHFDQITKVLEEIGGE